MERERECVCEMNLDLQHSRAHLPTTGQQPQSPDSRG